MSKGASDDREPVSLDVEVQTPTHGRVTAHVPLDARVGETVFGLCDKLGISGHENHALQVSLAREDGDPEWHTVEKDEVLLDALRGAQRAPRIVHESEGKEA